MKPVIKGPRILLYDLETTHNIVAAFNLYGKDYLPHDNILQERYIVCASWKFIGEKTINAASTIDDTKRYAANPHDDFYVVKRIAEAIEKADIIVAHNGDKYDWKFLNGRLIAHGFKPLPPVKKIDTLKVAKKHFLFNSNRLDYLGKYLGVGQKLKTKPGLWLKVLAGDRKAVQEMVIYNKRDVVLLEKVFTKLIAYLPALNVRLYGALSGCTRCGSAIVQRRGLQVNASRTYQRFQCMNCGGWFQDNKAESSTQSKSI